MADQKFISAANLFGWGQSFNATGKFPLIAKRVWNTYDDMIAFVSDTSDVCPAGVVLTVINDTDSKKNGAYFVASCPTLENPELEVKVEKIGSGEKVVATTYADALALATEGNVGSVIYVSEETEAGKAGLYVVTAVGAIERLGTTTATGDLSGDVAQLKTEVDTLEGTIDAVDQKINAIDLTPYAKIDDVNAVLDQKVSIDGYVAYTADEKSKLEGIADGAQVNVIERIIFNGTEVVVDAQTKSVTLTTPDDVVRGLADGEKVLAIDNDGKLGTTLGLTYFNEGETREIRLTGKGNEVIASIDAKSFVKDGMLDSVELIANPADQETGTYLVFTWNTESGVSEPMYVPVTDLIDVYTSGNGIAIDGKVITAKVKANDPYLEVTVEGIATKGIDNAITVAKNAVIGTDTDTIDSLTIQGVKKYVADLVSKHESAVTEVLNDYAVKSVDDTVVVGVSIVNNNGVVKVSVDKDTMVGELVGATGEIGPVSGTSVKLGQSIVSDDVEIISAGTTIQSAIQTIAGQVQAAVAGGITAIDGGEYITVGGTNTSKTLAVNVAKIGTYMVDNSSALKVSNEGKLTIEWENIE